MTMSLAERTMRAAAPPTEAAATGSGAFRCADCGLTVTAVHTLPVCDSCSGSNWVPVDWSPFSRRRR